MASNSSTKNKGALIFLHGLGDTPAGWSELESTLPSFHQRLDGLTYVFPSAPTIPISINGGMEMPGWFDLYDWPIDVGSQDDKAGLLKGVAQIEAAVQRLQEEEGIPASKIVVGGFSQGGAVALLAAYWNSGAASYAGCAGLSAWLTLPDELQVPDAVAKATPLFWGHGKYDDKVLFEQQSFGVEKLSSQGVSVTHKQYNVGHSSHPDEMQALADFVDACIFGNDDQAKTDL